jgi:fatty-acyl-CoA synthase
MTIADPLYADWLHQQIRVKPDQLAVHDLSAERSFTWQQLNDRVDALAHRLIHEGIAQGDRIAYLGLNSSDVIEIFFAAIRIGAIYVPLNFRLTAPELTYILGDCAPSAVFYDHAFKAVIEEIDAAAMPQLTVETTLDGGDSAYEACLMTNEAALQAAPANGDTQSMIMYSSGTTGKPKGVIYTRRMMLASALNLLQPSEASPDTRALNVMPLFHIGGMQFVLMTMKFGIPYLMMKSFDPAAMLAAIGDVELGITNIGGVPAMWSAMSLAPEIENTDLSRIRVAATGAESVPEPMLKDWQQRGILLQEVYGMTETGGVVCMAQKADLPKHMGYAGRALPYGELKVMTSESQEANPGELGEIWMRGASVTPGYWNRPDATEETFVGDWLKSGDIGRKDETGRLSVEDRIKDMYISGGENVYPAEIESILMAHPDIREVAVIGVPDSKWGEVGCAVIASLSGEAVSLDSVHALCERTLARFKWPQQVIHTEMLPRNSTGKVQKFLLRQAHS